MVEFNYVFFVSIYRIMSDSCLRFVLNTEKTTDKEICFLRGDVVKTFLHRYEG